jgi:hypothetical protein
MATRRAITKAQAGVGPAWAVKTEILDSVCAVTGFSRDYARGTLRAALRPRVVRPRPPRARKHDARRSISRGGHGIGRSQRS